MMIKTCFFFLLICVAFQGIFARAAPMPQLEGLFTAGKTALSGLTAPVTTLLGKAPTA